MKRTTSRLYRTFCGLHISFRRPPVHEICKNSRRRGVRRQQFQIVILASAHGKKSTNRVEVVSGARELDRVVGEGGLVLRRRRRPTQAPRRSRRSLVRFSAGRRRTCRSSVRPSARLAPQGRTRRRASLRAPAASIDLSTATNARPRETVFYEPRVPRRRGAALHHRQLAGRLLARARQWET